jgi:hypothetical protein
VRAVWGIPWRRPPRYGQPVPGSWRDIEAQLAAYRERSWQPAVYAIGSILVMLVIGLATDNIGHAFVPLIIGISAAIYLSTTLGVRCPACHRVMNDIGARGASPLTLLVNLKQCPMCQNKFDDATA